MYSTQRRYIKLGDVYFNKYNIESFTKTDDPANSRYELNIHTTQGQDYTFEFDNQKTLRLKIQAITGQTIQDTDSETSDLEVLPF